MTRLNQQEFYAWAYGDLFTNTTRGVLAEYIVAAALGLHETKRVAWNQYDLEIDGAEIDGAETDRVGIEVKSAAYVQSWEQTRSSKIVFSVRRAQGWDERTNTRSDSATRSAKVYVFCLLEGKDKDSIDPLDTAHWTFYVLPTSQLDRHVSTHKTIGLNRLEEIGARPRKYGELKAAIDEAAAFIPEDDSLPASPEPNPMAE